MLYFHLTLSVTATIISLYVCLNNLIRRFRFPVNRLFAVISLSATVMTGSLTYQLLYPGSPYTTDLARVYLAMISLINQFYFHYTQVFPRWEKRAPGWFIALTAIPGMIMFVLALFWNGILMDAGSLAGQLHYTFGPYYKAFLMVFAFNILGTLITNLYKTRVLENEAFRIQLFYRSIGDHIAALSIVTGFVVIPFFFNDQSYHPTGICIGSIILNLINNYALSDERLLDFKRFYTRTGYWLTVFLLLFVPSYLIIEYRDNISIGGQAIPLAGVALMIFLYFVLVFRFATPRIEQLFTRKYLRFERDINELFKDVAGISEIKSKEGYWDFFFNNTINSLESRFGISVAAFYMLNPRDNSFHYTHGYGENKLTSFEENTDLLNCVKEYAELLERSMLYTDERLSSFRDKLITFFKNYTIQVVIPFFNHEARLIGILTLGNLKNRKPYSADLVSALELYRIHFEVILANSLYIEEIAAAQTAEHDQLVIKTIKDRIIPKKMAHVPNIRISSLYLNHSEQGGDYFDSIPVRNDGLGIFMANTSSAGVASVLLALELYTVLHTHGPTNDSPERIMNLLNWVVTTSRFSEHNAPALYAVFNSVRRTLSVSNAGLNPLILFDSVRETFNDINTEGVSIGADKTFTYGMKSVQTAPGHIGIVYSGGLKAAINSEGVGYSLGRVKDIIRLNKKDTPAVLVRKIYNDITGFTSGTRLYNDISMIIFRIE